MKIEHIGIIVGNLEESIRAYQKALGLSVSTIEDYAAGGERARLAFLPIGESCIELVEVIESTGKPPALGIEHIAVEVEDIEAACASLKSAGLSLEPDTVMPGSRGSRVAYIRPSDMGGVSLELVEPARTERAE